MTAGEGGRKDLSPLMTKGIRARAGRWQKSGLKQNIAGMDRSPLTAAALLSVRISIRIRWTMTKGALATSHFGLGSGCSFVRSHLVRTQMRGQRPAWRSRTLGHLEFDSL